MGLDATALKKINIVNDNIVLDELLFVRNFDTYK
jgi:hypothetical protein